MEPARNDPCPCGSGKKFKKCCGSPAAAPLSPAQPWHDLDERLMQALPDFGRRRFGDSWSELLADYPVDEQEFEQVPEHMNLFLQWACHEHKFDDEPLADHYLESRGRNLPSAERDWLRAHQRAWLSIWEIVDLQEGAWLELVDLLTGERRRVMEVSGSRGVHKRLNLLARVLDHAGMSLLCGSHPHPLPPEAARKAVEALRESAGDSWPTKHIEPARLREGGVPTLLIDLWQEQFEALANRAAPRLTNTEGEELVQVKDTFALVGAGAREEMARRLAAEPDIQPPASARGAFVIESSAPGGGPDAMTTVIAHVTMTASELRLQTNSRERADRLRARLEQLGSGQLRHKSRKETDAAEMMAKAMAKAGSKRGRDSKPLQGPAELAAVLSFKQRHYTEWVDYPVPALDDLTPREAAENPALRARLSRLIKEMEELEGRGPPEQRYDFDEIRRELGLPDR